MLRRGHKKSRAGCAECKRRHVKCDEGRPVCRLCKMSERDCSFALEATPDPISGPGTPNYYGGSISPANSYSSRNDVPAIPTITPSSTSAPSPASSDRPNPIATADDPINFHHMELLSHMIIDKDLFSLGDDTGDPSFRLSFGLPTAIAFPYLLHQLMAFSARHLAFLNPDRSSSYLHQAVTLQTRAVSLFNAEWQNSAVDKNNCVPVLLFSTALGHHLLADSLCRRNLGGGLDAFLAHYLQCVETNRGIYAVCRAAWPLLMESELEPILSFSTGFTSRAPRGDHCRQLKELIDDAEGLWLTDKEACRLATRYLQVGFDALEAAEGDKSNNRYGMIFTWTMLVPPEFTNLLVKRRPEALVVLAYYALLLHYGRKMWQVGDAGKYILCLLEGYAGPEWESWLRYPREMIAKDVV